MTYTVIIKRSARKQIEKIPTSYIKKIKTAILNLADDPRPHGCVKLTGSKNIYRIREGVYRIVYEVTDNVLTVYVFDVDHRKQVYR
jgi:mRNA interferase RelE/StbE